MAKAVQPSAKVAHLPSKKQRGNDGNAKNIKRQDANPDDDNKENEPLPSTESLKDNVKSPQTGP
jgi:hypothetical protein